MMARVSPRRSVGPALLPLSSLSPPSILPFSWLLSTRRGGLSQLLLSVVMGGHVHGDGGGHRRLPQILLLSLLGFMGAACRAYASVDAPEPAPEAEQTEYLFMMTAGNATFVPGGGDYDGVLTLDGLDNETIAFTDRPSRDAFPISTEGFVAVASAPIDGPEDNSFYADPPNAAFSCPLGSGGVARAVYVLRAPSESNSDVAFEVQVLYTSVQGAIECGGPAVRRKMHVPVCPF